MRVLRTTIERLEFDGITPAPQSETISGSDAIAAATVSIAISLKRIADALQPQELGFRVGESLAAIAETLQERNS